jgi:hypothetical protein
MASPSPLENLRDFMQPRVEALRDQLEGSLRHGIQSLRHEANTRLRRRTLRRDLDHFWIRLGKTAFRMVESGEVQHPGLEKAMQRIRDIEEEMQTLERPQDS